MASAAFQDIRAIETIVQALDGLEASDQERVLRYVSERLGIAGLRRAPGIGQDIDDNSMAKNIIAGDIMNYSSASELLGNTSARTDGERALVVATHLQVCGQKNELPSQEINSELKHIGHQSSNITDALSSLMSQRPALVIQTKKTGKARQARKLYRVTDAGIARVKQMLKETQDAKES